MKLEPKFKINKSDRLYITDDYFSNGHWIVARNSIQKRIDCPVSKQLQQLLCLRNGAYYDGPTGFPKEYSGDITRVIPKRDEYLPIIDTPAGVKFVGNAIHAYYFFIQKIDEETREDQSFQIYVDPSYVPLIRLGYGFAKSKLDPILILKEQDINSDLVGAVMPMRF